MVPRRFAAVGIASLDHRARLLVRRRSSRIGVQIAPVSAYRVTEIHATQNALVKESRLVEATVYVSEDFDLDSKTLTTWWTGRFSCSLQGPGDLFEEGPSDVTIEKAISWGRTKADRILVRIGDGDHYSAGAVPFEDSTVEPWPVVGITVERRVWQGQEHLLRSESDPPIWWDVIVGIGAPGMDRPGVLERLIDALHAEHPPPGPGLQGHVL